VAIGLDGFARVSLLNHQGTGANFIQCTNSSCSTSVTSSIPFYGHPDAASLVIGSDGNASILGGSHTPIGSGFIDYFQCAKADCSTYSDQLAPGSWSNTGLISLALDVNGMSRMIAQTGSGQAAHIRPKVPTVLGVDNIALLPTGLTGDHGCTPTQDFGIELDITYQVYDNSKPPKPFKNSTMIPHEHVLYTASSDPRLVGQTVDTDICRNSRVSTCKLTTDLNGVFHDAPYGICADTPVQATFQQDITILLNKKSYPVRTNNVTEGSSSSGHGSLSNGTDIITSR